MIKIILLIPLLFTLLFLSSCDKYSPNDIHVSYNKKTDVICFGFNVKQGFAGMGGLSCVPREQTSLGKEEANQLNQF